MPGSSVSSYYPVQIGTSVDLPFIYNGGVTTDPLESANLPLLGDNIGTTGAVLTAGTNYTFGFEDYTDYPPYSFVSAVHFEFDLIDNIKTTVSFLTSFGLGTVSFAQELQTTTAGTYSWNSASGGVAYAPPSSLDNFNESTTRITCEETINISELRLQVTHIEVGGKCMIKPEIPYTNIDGGAIEVFSGKVVIREGKVTI